MKTMAEYIKSQDRPFSEKAFTPGDAVILSTLANIDFSYFYNQRGGGIVRLGDLIQDFLDFCVPDAFLEDLEFLEQILESDRYSNIMVSDAVHEVSKEEEKQFGAITFYPEDNLAFVGFMGTGTSVIGYKEDLNMAFMNIIPAQEEAVKYLNSIKEKLPDDLIVGGFSKGGNLAVFASAFCDPEVGMKIKEVYNHDGPGFTDLILNEKKYKSIKPLIKTYVPEASIVGLTLEHDNKYSVIKSTNKPIAQHTTYSWLFDGDDLYKVDKLSSFSNLYQEFLQELLDTMDISQRRDSINSLFDIIYSIEPNSFLNLADSNVALTKRVTDSWKETSRETKKHLFGLAGHIGKSVCKMFLPKRKKNN